MQDLEHSKRLHKLRGITNDGVRCCRAAHEWDECIGDVLLEAYRVPEDLERRELGWRCVAVREVGNCAE